MKSWRMGLWLLIALGLAAAAGWSLISLEAGQSEPINSSPQPERSQSEPKEEIGEHSRQALRNLLREAGEGDGDR